MGKKDRVNNDVVYNFRDLLKRYQKYGDNIAFEYKQKGKIKTVTYKKFAEDIKALRNSYFKFR